MFVNMIYLKTLPVPHNTREKNEQVLSSEIKIQIPGRLFQIIQIICRSMLIIGNSELILF